MEKKKIALVILASVLLVFLAFFLKDRYSKPEITIEEPLKFVKAREMMVEKDLKGRDITDERVLKAMGKIPRHLFVSEDLQEVAYEDHPLPIEEGQTISQPYVVALMTQSLELKGDERVLEIGTGSGYQASVLAEIALEVYTIEIRENLSKSAGEVIRELGYENIRLKVGDGYFGWEEHAPFDAIMITAAVDHIPPPLIKQLKRGGKLILPLGSTKYYQTLTLVEKNEELDLTYITSVRFVPMIGEALKGEPQEVEEEKTTGILSNLIILGILIACYFARRSIE